MYSNSEKCFKKTVWKLEIFVIWQRQNGFNMTANVWPEEGKNPIVTIGKGESYRYVLVVPIYLRNIFFHRIINFCRTIMHNKRQSNIAKLRKKWRIGDKRFVRNSVCRIQTTFDWMYSWRGISLPSHVRTWERSTCSLEWVNISKSNGFVIFFLFFHCKVHRHEFYVENTNPSLNVEKKMRQKIRLVLLIESEYNAMEWDCSIWAFQVK